MTTKLSSVVDFELSLTFQGFALPSLCCKVLNAGSRLAGLCRQRGFESLRAEVHHADVIDRFELLAQLTTVQMGMAPATERQMFTGALNKRSAVARAQQYTRAPNGQQMTAATTPHTSPHVGPTILHRQGFWLVPSSMHNMVHVLTPKPCADL